MIHGKVTGFFVAVRGDFGRSTGGMGQGKKEATALGSREHYENKASPLCGLRRPVVRLSSVFGAEA
jgi:hypothetical protein